MHLYNQIIEYEDFEASNFTTTEFRILEYVRDNLDRIDEINVTDISAACFCSTASIHRFVNKFGCQGYKQFKSEILASKVIDNSSYSEFGGEVISGLKHIESIEIDNFVQSIKQLKGKRVYIYALGASQVSALYFARLLSEVDIDATSYVPYELSGIKETAEAIFVISNSGETRPVIEQAQRYLNENMPVYALTRSNSSLAKLVENNLVHNNQFNNNHHVRRESQLYLMLMIERLFDHLI